MVFKNDKPKLGIIKIVIISVAMIFILCILSYYVLGSIGIIYMKNGEGEKVYDFIEDMDYFFNIKQDKVELISKTVGY